MYTFSDPLIMPETGEGPEDCYIAARPLIGTPGQAYVERRGIPVEVAHAAGVRYKGDYGCNRPAVIAPLENHAGKVVSVHGRYLHRAFKQNKMLTVGQGGGTINVLGGWKVDPLILVEGLFDALTLATCEWASVASIGRLAPWLPTITSGRIVWLAFDTGRPAEKTVEYYTRWLCNAEVRRMPPLPRCKDWNTALVKCGRASVANWIRQCLGEKTGVLQ